MCSALVSVHGLKNEFIFMCSALVSAHGLRPRPHVSGYF